MIFLILPLFVVAGWAFLTRIQKEIHIWGSSNDYPDPYDCVGGVSQVADAGVQEGALQAPRDRGQVSSSLHQAVDQDLSYPGGLDRIF